MNPVKIMKKSFLLFWLISLSCAYAADSKLYTPELCRQIDVIDYPEIPGYGTLPFKVFQPQSDWKCEQKNGRLILHAKRQTTIEKQWDNDLLHQKMSFSYTNSAKSHIMLTVYVKGAKGKVNIIRKKLTGNGTWSEEFKTPHLIKNTKFDNSDKIEEHYTADKITLRIHLTPGAEVDITSASFQAIPDILDAKNTPFKTSDGKEIIAVKLPENPDYWQLFAAARLRKYLYLQTNKLLPLMVGKSPSDNMINIGFADSSLDEGKEKNVFRTVSGKKILISAGKTSNLVYGSYELLKRCGFKFYGRFNQVIPAEKEVIFPKFENKQSTTLAYRYFNLYGDMVGMGYSNKKIIAPALHDRDLPHHNDVFIVPASLFETKPELFALGKDGKRRDPRNRREQPKCFSHPEVRQLYKEAARKYLKAAPHAEYVILATCDFHNWCLCSRCRAQDKEGSWTKVYMDMINEVANEVLPEFPGKKIIAYAYTYTAEPVENLKMHPSVVISYAFYKPYFTSDSVNDSFGNRKGWQQLSGWQKSVANGNIIAFVYPTQFQTRYALTMPFTATCERIKYSIDNNFNGFIICGVTPQFEELMTFIWGKMFWDEKADIQALIKEHMDFYYGKKASPYMVKYFNRIYQHVKEKKPNQYCEFPIIGSVSPELLDDLHKLLDQAIAAAPKSGQAYRSLMHHKAVLLYSELDEFNVNNAPVNNDYKRFALRSAELIKLLGKKVLFTNYPYPYREVSAWFSHVTGIQIKNKQFWLDPEMKKFLAAPEVKPKKINIVSGNIIRCNDFTGAQYFPKRSVSRANICIRRASSPWNRAIAQFSGKNVSKIVFTGMTELESVPAEISINGTTLFSGNIKFDKGPDKWGEFHLDVPENILNENNNKLVINNTCPDPEGNAPYTYGWIDIWRAELKRNK